MSKRFAFLIAVFLTCAALCACQVGAKATDPSEFYPETAVVVSLDSSRDMVTVQNSQGILWSFYGCSDYCYGDVISLLMEANSTPEITDDVVLEARYSGFDAPELSPIPDMSANIQTVEGRFFLVAEMQDLEGNVETCYQFRSNDDAVWWLLSADELGFIPQLFVQEYVLAYDNNGTTQEHKPCDCPPEYNCECEVYDDEFLYASPVATIERMLCMY